MADDSPGSEGAPRGSGFGGRAVVFHGHAAVDERGRDTALVMTLESDLRRLGIVSGDVVMVHASMRAVGGRAEDVVSALLSSVGGEGCVFAYVDFESSDDPLVFDRDTSPAAKDHGVLAEVVRKWPGAVRSTNPGASIAAIGGRAEWLTADHPMHYGYGPRSPLAKLVEVSGKVLLLGSHFDHVTLLHHAEHLADLPNKRVVRYPVRVGAEVITIEELDTSEGVVDGMPEAYFDRVVRAFVDGGGANVGRVGGALSYLLPARELVTFAVARMERDLR